MQCIQCTDLSLNLKIQCIQGTSSVFKCKNTVCDCEGTSSVIKCKEYNGTAVEIIIMYIYHALVNALSAHMIPVNLNTIFYTHVEHSPTKQFT